MIDTPHPSQPSPCVGICRIEPANGLCVGCHRNLEEICAWLGLDEGERLAIMRECEVREARIAAAGAADRPDTHRSQQRTGKL